MANSPVLTCVQLAQRFGEFLAAGDYEGAWELLTREAQLVNPPADLKSNTEGMHTYAPGPIAEVKAMDRILEDWPAKQDGDVASVYVALVGGNFCEAVYLTVAHEHGQLRIRDIEWGRP